MPSRMINGLNYHPPRTATYVVAASNSPAHVKAQADYVCDGTADNVEIQAAIDALPAAGGTVLLSQGTFNIAVAIQLKPYARLEGQGLTTLKPAGNNHVIIFPGGNARMAQLAHVYIWDEMSRQTDTAAILLDIDVGNDLFGITIEYVSIRNTWDGIRSAQPATFNIADSVFLGFFHDILIHDIRNQAIIFRCFYDCIFRDIKVWLTAITASLTDYNVTFSHDAKDSGTWVDKLSVHGRKGAISSGDGILIDNVRSFWMTDCFVDVAGKFGIVFGKSLLRSSLSNVRAQDCAQHGFVWFGNCTDEVHLFNCLSVVNQGWGFLSVAGDTSTKYILGGASQGNASGALSLNHGTKIIKNLRGYVNENSGTASFNGTGAQVAFVFAHGLAATPTHVKISPKTDDAAGDWKWWADGTNVAITFMTAPQSGANNVVFSWEAII